MEHQEIYEWLKELAFKNCDKKNREQIFWFFEDILEDEIKVEKQEDEIEKLNNIINELEKILDENVELTYVHCGKRQYNKTLTEGGLLFRDYIKSKLQELKGSDKE